MTGATYLFTGLNLITQPGVRMLVAIPLCINILLFVLLLSTSWSFFSDWLGEQMTAAPGWIPEWLQEWIPSFIESLISGIAALVSLLFALFLSLVAIYSFAIVASIIASPFYGVLSEKIQQQLTGKPVSQDSGVSAALKIIPHSIARELKKTLYYLPRLLGLVLLSFIPVLGFIAPLLLIIFGAWMMAIQYTDYPMDNNKVDFPGMLQQLRERRLSSLGFGGITMLLMSFPIVNIFVMPAAVAGATAFYVKEYYRDPGTDIVSEQ